MGFQIFLNHVLAILWMMMTGDWNFSGFVKGYIAGLLLIFLLRRFHGQPVYVVKIWASIKLLFVFLSELTKANISVLGHLMRPKLNIRPGTFAIPTQLKGDLEITILVMMIILTPGTVALEVSDEEDEETIVYIHAIDEEDAKATAETVKNRYEKAIMGVTR